MREMIFIHIAFASILLSAGIAICQSQLKPADRKEVARKATAAHKRAAEIADDKVPPFDPTVYSVALVRYGLKENEKIYDREYSRLLKPTEKKYGLTESQIDVITERVLAGK